jgi:hypothetical protein
MVANIIILDNVAHGIEYRLQRKRCKSNVNVPLPFPGLGVSFFATSGKNYQA